MSKIIDLNVDIGEGFPFDKDLLAFATSANVCCGEHAGSPELTRETVAMCREKGVRVGIHPGYPDRAGMGRNSIDSEHERAYLSSVFQQVRWFNAEFAPEYVKPHGAFYGDTAVILPVTWELGIPGVRSPSRYEAGGAFLAQYSGIQSLIMLLRITKLPLLGLPGTAHLQAAVRAGQPFLKEGFADRAYLPSGALVPRSSVGAILQDSAEVKAQVIRLALEVDSICLHGDGANCLEFAELIVRTLHDEGFEIRA